MIFYDIKDNLTGFYEGILFGAPNDEVAKRSVRIALTTGKGLPALMVDSPEDYSLWKVGEYDKATGLFVSDVKMINHFVEIKNGKDNSL